MIEKHYSKFITEHSDDVSRHALLQPSRQSERMSSRSQGALRAI